MSTVTDTTIASSPAVVEYKLIIEKSLKGNEDAITQKFTDELQKPEIEDKAIKDIRNLTKTIKEIKAGFERIAGSFVEFDGANFKDKDDNVLKLGPSWEDFYKVSAKILVSIFYSKADLFTTAVHTYSGAEPPECNRCHSVHDALVAIPHGAC